ncbi:MAG: beta-propeller fold lactonase family protein [Enterocloster bolteae]
MGYRIYIGTYTEEIHFASGKVVYGKGEGIYKLWLDSEQERLVCVSVACGCRNPSYLALSRDGNYICMLQMSARKAVVFMGAR